MAVSHRSRPTGHVQLRQLKSGATFYLKSRVPGRVPEQTTTRLGPAHNGKGRPPEGSYTRRMAEDALAEFLTDARRGEHDTTAPVEPAAVVTFDDAAAEFLTFIEDVRKRDASTVRDYRSIITCHLLYTFGGRDLFAITPDDVDAYKERRVTQGELSPQTIVHHLNVLYGDLQAREADPQAPG